MHLFKKAISLSRSAINRLENSEVPMIYVILTFIVITSTRTFLEVFSDHIEIAFGYVLHYGLFYTSVALASILIFRLITGTEAKKLFRIAFPSFIVIFIAPIFDLIISKGKGLDMTYLLPGKHGDLLLRFFTFFGDFQGQGITPGIRVGLALGIIGSFFYVYVKKSSVIKGLLSALVTYIMLFLYGIAPFIVKWLLELFRVPYEWSDQLFSNFFLTTILLILIALAFIEKKDYIKALLEDIRLTRSLAMFFLLVMGAALGWSKGGFEFTGVNIFHFVFVPVSLFFALLFLITNNNIADYDIDKVSNKNRPLVTSAVSLGKYKELSWYCLIISLFFAIMVSFPVFFIMLLFVGFYFMYSSPPLRLKRVLLVSKVMVSAPSLLMVMLGFVFIRGSIEGFPGILIAAFLAGGTLTANMIDLKDYEGDKAAGVKTLPVVFGLKKAKIITGLFIMLTYFSICLIVKEFYLQLLFIILGVFLYFLVIRKKYDEKPIFAVFLLTIIILIINYL